MTYLAPCNGCRFQKSTCARRDQIKSGIKGLGITTLKFRCNERTPLYSTGQRIAFPWRVYGDADYYDQVDKVDLVFHGTIVGETDRGNRYIVLVDAGPCVAGEEEIDASDAFRNPDLIIKVRRREIKPLSEPFLKICCDCAGFGDERCMKGPYTTPSTSALCMERLS